MGFTNIEGLWLLGFLIPLLILYMIKVKPKIITIPSLMFFSDDTKVKKYRSILKKFLLRLLLILQALFIIFAALSAAKPTVRIPVDAYSLNTVVIMDVSASMGTKEGAITRFDMGKTKLLEEINGRVTIVLAEENPVVLASNVSASKAKAVITSLANKDVRGRLDSAILLADELLGNNRGNIIVYSDFNIRKEDDILAAKKIAEANDKRVVFQEVGDKHANLGWVILNFNLGRGEAFIKNFGDRNEVVDIRFKGYDKAETKRIEIPSFSVEKVGFEINKGETVLELVQKDRLDADDSLYIINPYDDLVKVLLITNERDLPVKDALEANNLVDLAIAVPPVIPDLDYDIVVVGRINRNNLLPNTFRDIKKFKDSGGKVIVMAQEDIDQINFQDLLAFGFNGVVSEEKDVCVDVVNEFTSRLNPRCFTSVLRHYPVSGNNSLAVASTIDGSPIFLLSSGIFYYGIIDRYSGFKEQINYPLFWNDVINNLLGRQSLSEFNYQTGQTLVFGNGTRKQNLARTGIIDTAKGKVAVNLLDADESDIFRESVIKEKEEFSKTRQKVNLEVPIDRLLLYALLFLFFFELFYIKRRGDL